MKKLLFSVIAFTLLTTSCYKDDFKALNGRLDALAAQVAGIATLQTSITALTAQVTSLQTAVAAIPNYTATLAAISASITSLSTNLTALSATVTSIQNALNTLATAVANNQTSTTALLNQLIAQTTANQAATAQLIADLQTALTAAIANSNADLTTLIQTQIAAAIAANQAAIDAAQAALLLDNANQTAVLTALINALQASVNTANANILILLANQNIYEGDLIINDETTLVFAEGLLNRVNLVKGNVTINTTALDAGQIARLDVVTGKMYSVIGVGNTWSYTGFNPGGFPNLSSINGTVVIASGGFLNLSALTLVNGSYTVAGVDIDDSALATVLGNFSLTYPGAYSSTSLATIGGTVSLNNNGVSPTSINFPNLTSSGLINAGTPSWPFATSIVLGSGQLTSLTAASATTITLGQLVYSGALTISAPVLTTLNMSATSIAGAFTVNAGTAGAGTNPVLNISSLASTGGAVFITTAGAGTGGTVNLNVYASNQPVQIEGPLTQSLPAYTVNIVTSATIRTLTMPVYRANTNVGTQFVTLTALRNLTVGDVRATITGASFVNLTTLQSLTATASVYAVQINLTNMTALTTVSTAGLLQQLNLNNDDAVTSVTTAGQMDNFIVNDCDNAGLTIAMGHSYVTSILGMGSTTIVTDNGGLTSLTTSTSRMKNLTVTNNPLLSTANFSSFIAGDNITSGSVAITVHNNNLVAGYTQSIFATNTPPVIVQASLSTLKAYAINLLQSPMHTTNVALGFSLTNLGGDATIATLDGDRAAYITAAGGPGAPSFPENFTFVQRDLDADGAVGSYLGVVRELNYIQ